MTPKEKAKQLVNKFAIYLRANLMHDEDADEDAKECALILLDELLASSINAAEYNYYVDVKQEIEKL